MTDRHGRCLECGDEWTEDDEITVCPECGSLDVIDQNASQTITSTSKDRA